MPEAATGMYNLCLSASTCFLDFSIIFFYYLRERFELINWHVRPKTRCQQFEFQEDWIKNELFCWRHLLPRTLGAPISPYPFSIILIVPKKNSTIYFAYEPGPDGLSFFSRRYLRPTCVLPRPKWDVGTSLTEHCQRVLTSGEAEVIANEFKIK